ncbi:aminotransferase class V-fold PLP-dependent enzyme [Treponema zioleckii]|uniref:aminotransferase class V-fold PLP-dependent enzyme n=1 Tax=Treponema zioleckii TaxID=331680 RepID=UPI00168B2599|nr:aminotransferase class V-fold PLP-dependent enzyme [Treponema zioleckii]
MGFVTDSLHKGVRHEKNSDATLPPICQVSAFGFQDMETLEDVFNGKAAGFAYTRIGNPTVAAFEQRISALEHGFGAVATSSGMAAISQALLNFLSTGDEIIASGGLYGGTIQLFTLFRQLGITVHYANDLSSSVLEKILTPNVKAVFAEVISNPALKITDLKSLADFCHSHSLPLLVDSTTATPFLVNPIDFGADIVIHSSSKYINGTSNSISGVIIDSGKFDWDFDRYPALKAYSKFKKMAYLMRLRKDSWASLGGCLSPFNAYMNIIGLETLGLRMERICNNAHKLALALSKIPGTNVNYPLLGIENDEQNSLCKTQLKGFGGGILTLRTGSREKTFKTINSLKLATVASNIGDVRTLVIAPAKTLYLHNTEEEMHAAGVYEDTIRVSVGIEDAEDLIEDFTQALKSAL